MSKPIIILFTFFYDGWSLSQISNIIVASCWAILKTLLYLSCAERIGIGLVFIPVISNVVNVNVFRDNHFSCSCCNMDFWSSSSFLFAFSTKHLSCLLDGVIVQLALLWYILKWTLIHIMVICQFSRFNFKTLGISWVIPCVYMDTSILNFTEKKQIHLLLAM